MNKFKSISFVATSMAAVTLTHTQILANTSEENIQTASNNEISLMNKSLHSGCEQPANREYHSVLSTFEGDNDGDYKFSGCGSAI